MSPLPFLSESYISHRPSRDTFIPSTLCEPNVICVACSAGRGGITGIESAHTFDAEEYTEYAACRPSSDIDTACPCSPVDSRDAGRFMVPAAEMNPAYKSEAPRRLIAK